MQGEQIRVATDENDLGALVPSTLETIMHTGGARALDFGLFGSIRLRSSRLLPGAFKLSYGYCVHPSIECGRLTSLIRTSEKAIIAARLQREAAFKKSGID